MRVNVVQRKETGQYRVKVTAKDENGVWVTKWVKGSFLTEQEAKAVKAEVEANATRGQVTTLDRSSVGAYLDEWLALRRSMGQIEASSAASYMTMLARVKNCIGALPLATLTHKDVQAAYAKIIAVHGASAAHFSHCVFKAAIRDAVKNGRLLSDPFLRVEPPRVKTLRKQVTLTADQVQMLVERTRGTNTGRMIELLAVTGMRVGEASALQWSDFDFERNRIRITKNMAVLPGGGCYVKGPKSASGIRTVAVPAETMAAFKARAGKPDEFVFKTNNSRNWSRRVRFALQQAGLGQFTTHDLRHAHATFLLKHTPNPKLVSKRLGHSDVKITLGIYAHVFEGDDDELGEAASALTKK